jgi:PAS domain S-box-containing protein
MSPMKSFVTKRIKFVTAVVGCMLTVVIGALLWATYAAQISQRLSASTQFQSDGERLSVAIGYFFAERKDDIRNLSECRELSAFFENRALGMSMAYGLRASQLAIAERFRRVLERKQFHEDLIYDRIVFVDRDANVLVDVTNQSEAGRGGEANLGRYLSPDTQAPVLLAEHAGSSLIPMVSVAYFFKNTYAGQILAWLSPRLLFKHLLKPENTSSQRQYGIVCSNGDFHLGQDHLVSSFSQLTPNDHGGPLDPLFDGIGAGVDKKKQHKMLAVRIPVQGGPYSIGMVAPAAEVFGLTAPWILPATMGILTVLVLGGSISLWRFNTRNAVLQVRYEETTKREHIVRDKSVQLEREIAERMRFEAALRESENKYRSIFESFQDIYFRTDEEDLITVLSPSAEIESGYQPEELVGCHTGKFFGGPAERERLMGTLLAAGVVNDYELKLRKKDGTMVDVSMNAKLLRNSVGQMVGVEGVLRNISRRKKDQDALEENRRRLDMALKGGDMGVWDWSIPTGQVTFNHRWATMLGYELDEIEPNISIWEQLSHPEDRSSVMEALRAHSEGKTSYYEAEHRFKSKSGAWKWIFARGQVVKRDSSGRSIRIIGTHMDITSRKTAELEIKKYQENLELLVVERTQKLKQAQKELVSKAMEAGRAQLAAMVLHNIGNAVTPIRVHLDAVRSDSTSHPIEYLEKCILDLNAHMDDLQQYVQADERGRQVFGYMTTLIDALKKIDRQRGDKLRKLDEGITYISEVLTLQQAYAANSCENKERIDLNSLLADAVRMQNGALEKRDIKIVQEFNRQAPQLIIDKNRLMQVIVNIIKNGYEAIDLQADGTGVKDMAVKSFAENGQIGFSISDSGIGLAPGVADDVFEFGHSSKGSSGFGLYYCRMFVEANGGNMELTSPGSGKGAAVTVSFPVGGIPAKSEASAARAAAASRVAQIN